MSVAPEWFMAALDRLGAGDMSGWMNIFDEDAIHEFPVAPDWQPKRLEGKSTIAAYMATGPSTVTPGSWELSGVREAGDELIINGTAIGKCTASQTPFFMEFVWFITHENGRVKRFQDYMNPLRFTDADAASTAIAAGSNSAP
jgi:ketosteroid isomerase-like protein